MRILLLRAAARFYLRHPWQLVLAIVGVALGVAVYVGVSLANDSARRAFALSSEAVIGRTTHRVLAVGGELPETVYADIVTDLGITRAAPVVEAEVDVLADRPRRTTLIGIDPVKEPAVRSLVGLAPGGSGDAVRLIVEPDAVLVPRRLVEALALRRDQALELRIGGRVHRVRAVGTVGGAAPELPLVADIATVQTLAGRAGTLDRIDLRLDEREAGRLAAALPAGTTLVPAGRDPAFEQLTAAFHTNLTALGLLALVVGMFLIYTTMSFAIVQRRTVLGTLLAIGLARRELLLGVLAEALVIGGIATAAGLVLGHVLAQGLVELMLRTIGDLAFASRVGAAAPSPVIYVVGAVLGIAVTVLSALGPAVDAARSAPEAAMRRAALERRSSARVRVAAWAALPALAAAGLLLAADPRSLPAAFAGLFFVLLAGALLTPAATVLLMRLLEPGADRAFGLSGLLAVRGVTASLSRTGVAAAALAVAVATVIGIGLMISSFRTSLVEWLDTTLTADLYLTLDDTAGVGDELSASILEIPGVTGVSSALVFRLPTRYGEISIRAARPGPEGWGLAVVSAAPGALEALASTPSVALAEPFAYRHGLGVGDRLALPTPAGERELTVVAVYRDYNAGGSAALMSLDQYRSRWGDAPLSSVGVHVADRARLGAIGDEVAALVPGGAGRVVSTAGVVEVSLDVFDRTFQITEVLRLLAASIAFLGVLSAVLSIELERAGERAVLRAVGFSPRDLATLTLTQTTLLGLAAAVAAVPLGSALAWLLVHVINRRSFGWTMSFDADPQPAAVGAALAVGAAFLAGIPAALRVRRAELGKALREE